MASGLRTGKGGNGPGPACPGRSGARQWGRGSFPAGGDPGFAAKHQARPRPAGAGPLHAAGGGTAPGHGSGRAGGWERCCPGPPAPQFILERGPAASGPAQKGGEKSKRPDNASPSPTATAAAALGGGCGRRRRFCRAFFVPARRFSLQKPRRGGAAALPPPPPPRRPRPEPCQAGAGPGPVGRRVPLPTWPPLRRGHLPPARLPAGRWPEGRARPPPAPGGTRGSGPLTAATVGARGRRLPQAPRLRQPQSGAGGGRRGEERRGVADTPARPPAAAYARREKQELTHLEGRRKLGCRRGLRRSLLVWVTLNLASL